MARKKKAPNNSAHSQVNAHRLQGAQMLPRNNLIGSSCCLSNSSEERFHVFRYFLIFSFTSSSSSSADTSPITNGQAHLFSCASFPWTSQICLFINWRWDPTPVKIWPLPLLLILLWSQKHLTGVVSILSDSMSLFRLPSRLDGSTIHDPVSGSLPT